ncbi:MAG: hypothetical protein V4553_17250 [Bacteroidota bacterium]
MKILLTLFILSFSAVCFGQTHDLKDFIETPAPKPYSPEWYTMGGKNWKSYKTSIVKGKLNITDLNNNNRGAEYKLPGGTLWAINVGEFGGTLYYQPNDTTLKYFNVNGKPTNLKSYNRNFYTHMLHDSTQKSRLKSSQFELMGGNIDSFFKYRDSIYFIEGLAHMGINRGAVYKIEVNEQGCNIKKVLEIDNAPASFLIKGDRIYLATFGRFYIFNKWKKELELDNLFWTGLGPNELVMANKNTLYTGIIGGYAKIDLKAKKVTLYKYSKTIN